MWSVKEGHGGHHSREVQAVCSNPNDLAAFYLPDHLVRLALWVDGNNEPSCINAQAMKTSSMMIWPRMVVI